MKDASGLPSAASVVHDANRPVAETLAVAASEALGGKAELVVGEASMAIDGVPLKAGFPSPAEPSGLRDKVRSKGS